MLQDVRYAIRAFARTPGFTAAARALARARRRRQHRHLQRRERAAAAAAAVPGRRPAGHPLEPLARPGHRRGLVLDRAVLRHQDRPSRVRAGRDRDRRQRQPDRRRRARAHRHDPRLVEPAADARRARRRSGGCSPPRRTLPAPPATAVLGHGTWMRRYGGDPRVVGALDHAERPALSDRRRAARVVLAAARGDADARRRRGRRDRCCRCRSPPNAAESARTARTTTSSAS